MNVFEHILAAFLVIVALAALAQLLRIRRMARQAQAWLVDSSRPLDHRSFERFHGVALCVWLALALVAAIITGSSVVMGRFVAVEEVVGGAIVGLCSVLMALLSGFAVRAIRETDELAASQAITDNDELREEVARYLPQGSPPVMETRESLRRQWASLEKVSLWCFLAGSVALAFVMLAATGSFLEDILSGGGAIIAIGLAILIPGALALWIARWAVRSKAERAQFLWFLALTAEKQRPLADELEQWAKAHSGRFGLRVFEAAQDIASGDALAESLAGRDLVAPSDLISIRVGETTGRLAETLRDAAIRQTTAMRHDTLDSTTSGPLLYFGALVLVAVNITMFLMFYIVPKFKAIFSAFETELPGVTILLINVSDFVAQYFYLFAWIPLLAVIVIWACGEAYFKGWSETWLAWASGVGRQAEVPRLLRRMRQAVLANLPWDRALRPLVLHHPQESIRMCLERVLGRVTAGMSLWPAMQDSSLLTARDVSLLEMAERANNLPWTLAALADAKERNLAHRWRVIVTLLMPVGIFCGGACVLFICVGFFMPLVKLLNDLS